MYWAYIVLHFELTFQKVARYRLICSSICGVGVLASVDDADLQ
jgi:heme/copper-type cytochrome/quinol oxidase subunit 2